MADHKTEAQRMAKRWAKTLLRIRQEMQVTEELATRDQNWTLRRVTAEAKAACQLTAELTDLILLL